MFIVPNLLNLLFTIYAVGIPLWRIFNMIHIDAVLLFACMITFMLMHREIMFASGNASFEHQFVQIRVILMQTNLRTITRFSNHHSTIKSFAWMGDVACTCLLIIPIYTCMFPDCPSWITDCHAIDLPVNYVYMTCMYISFQLNELIMQSLSTSWQSRLSRHIYLFALAALHEYVHHDLRAQQLLLFQGESRNTTYTYQ